jgi:hypothetical protein
LGGDVGGELHHLVRLSAGVEDGVVGSLNPDLLPTLADPLVHARIEFAAVEFRPEGLILAAGSIRRFSEHAVVFALDLIQAVSQTSQEVVVRGDNGAVEVEFDDCLRLADGGQLALRTPPPCSFVP